MYIRPPPLAIKIFELFYLFKSPIKYSNGVINVIPDVSPTSLPSNKVCTRISLISFEACYTIAFKWSICECTLPSENKPKKWSFELYFLT